MNIKYCVKPSMSILDTADGIMNKCCHIPVWRAEQGYNVRPLTKSPELHFSQYNIFV